jgi:hypothetical protein
MKINGRKYDTMKRAMTALVESMGGAIAVKELYVVKLLATGIDEHRKQTRMVWDLWSTAERSLLYDDTHPGFVKGHWVRVVQHLPGWSVYTDGVNDVHIETALRKIGAELGIL